MLNPEPEINLAERYTHDNTYTVEETFSSFVSRLWQGVFIFFVVLLTHFVLFLVTYLA